MSRLQDAINDLKGNDRQWEAFTAKGLCAVLAPPGSGKTKLLTTRLAHDLAVGAIPPPQGAACITMTNEAARELRRRLRDLGVRPRANIFVGTVHAFALSSIVGPYAAATGRDSLAASRLASAAETAAAFGRSVDAIYDEGRTPQGAEFTMNKMRRLGDYSGDRMLGGERIVRLARHYEDDLATAGMFDFNDLMRHAVAMLQENEWLRRVLVSVYPHLYVDEYQDLPPALDDLVHALCFDQAVDATLFAVGDPDQAIFGFMGTRPQLLLDLADRDQLTDVRLEINYRSGQDIIDASLDALGEKRVIRGNKEGGEIVIETPVDGPEAQPQRARELVQHSLSDGTAAEQILVLTQGTAERELVVQELRQAGIPSFARSDADYGATPITMAIEALASYATDDSSSATLLSDRVDEWSAVIPGRLGHADATALIYALKTVRADTPAAQFIDALVPLGLASLVADPGASQDGRELERLRHAVQSGGLAGLTTGALGERARATGRVMVSTMHGAKGLEFDTVIVCDCEKGRIPHWGSLNSENAEAEVAEDRRKFYVALTRARMRVHLLSSAWRISKRGNRYSIEISPFVKALIPS